MIAPFANEGSLTRTGGWQGAQARLGLSLKDSCRSTFCRQTQYQSSDCRSSQVFRSHICWTLLEASQVMPDQVQTVVVLHQSVTGSAPLVQMTLKTVVLSVEFSAARESSRNPRKTSSACNFAIVEEETVPEFNSTFWSCVRSKIFAVLLKNLIPLQTRRESTHSEHLLNGNYFSWILFLDGSSGQADCGDDQSSWSPGSGIGIPPQESTTTFESESNHSWKEDQSPSKDRWARLQHSKNSGEISHFAQGQNHHLSKEHGGMYLVM